MDTLAVFIMFTLVYNSDYPRQYSIITREQLIETTDTVEMERAIYDPINHKWTPKQSDASIYVTLSFDYIERNEKKLTNRNTNKCGICAYIGHRTCVIPE